MKTKRLKWTSTDNSCRDSPRNDGSVDGRETPKSIMYSTPTVAVSDSGRPAVSESTTSDVLSAYVSSPVTTEFNGESDSTKTDSDMFTKSTKSLKPCKVLKSSTKLSSPMSMEINSDSSDSASETENRKCAFPYCNKMPLNFYKNTIFFGFPLENQILLKQWLDIVKLPTSQPSKSDIICSDHFEKHHITKKINNIYMLEEFAIPSVKPMNPFVLNPRNLLNNSKEIDDILLVLSKNRLVKKRGIENITDQSNLIETSSNEDIPKSILSDELAVCYRCMGLAICENSCDRMCYYAIPDFERRYIYQEFKMLESVIKQNCRIAQLIHTIESEPSYYLIAKNKPIEVCRLFFINTLGIPECRPNAILNPVHYAWFSNRENALKSQKPKQENKISESMNMTDFVKNSFMFLENDLNESESDSKVSLDMSTEEYKKAYFYIISFPRVLYTCQENSTNKSFDISISLDCMYELYSENHIKNKIPPPYTKRQFKKIYNQVSKSIKYNVI